MYPNVQRPDKAKVTVQRDTAIPWHDLNDRAGGMSHNSRFRKVTFITGNVSYWYDKK